MFEEIFLSSEFSTEEKFVRQLMGTNFSLVLLSVIAIEK